MRFGKSMAVVLLAACLLTFAGCGGGSPADQAAEEIMDLAKEMKSLTENPADMAANLGKLIKKGEALDENLKAEMAKMTPEEKKAFEAKWEAKFKEEFGDMDSPFGS